MTSTITKLVVYHYGKSEESQITHSYALWHTQPEREAVRPARKVFREQCMGRGKVGWLDFRRLNYHIKKFGFYSVDSGSHRSFLVRD